MTTPDFIPSAAKVEQMAKRSRPEEPEDAPESTLAEDPTPETPEEPEAPTEDPAASEEDIPF